MPVTESTLSNQMYEYKKDPTSLSKFLIAMLWISFGIYILTVVSGFMELNLLKDRYTREEAALNDIRELIVGLLYVVAYIVTAITFLRWIHRANLNCHGFGAEGMKFTPGWSIGYYFIPILNFFKPYQAMKEIWKVSTNPVGWKNVKGSPLLDWW